MKNFLKNKINAFKANTSRFQVQTLNEWLNSQGLQETAENRALYAQYRLNIDEKNKQQDKNLSRFIGSLIWIAVFLTIFAIALSQQIGATAMGYGDYILRDIDREYYASTGYLETCTIPYNNCNNSYTLTFNIFQASFSQNRLVHYLSVDTNNIENLYQDIFTNLESDVDMLNDNDIYNYYLETYNVDISTREFGYYITFDFISQLIQNYSDIVEKSAENARQQGYSEGYSVGYSVGSQTGYDDGYNDGDEVGYNNGYTDGMNEGETLKKGIFAIFDAPVNMLHSILNFEIMGINLYSIFTFIITLCLLAILTKTIFGLFN